MILVIAEKPSVAQSIAKVLGAASRKDGYLEGNNYIVSWCVGHLVGLADASSYDERYAKWRYDDLPIVPEEWLFEVPKDKAQQFKVLRDLMRDKRVTELVCATDAGREGELIFRLVYNKAGCTNFNLAYSKPESFIYFDEQKPFGSSWTDLYVTFVAIICEDYPHLLVPGMSFSNRNSRVELARNDNYSFMIDAKPVPGTDLMLETNISASNMADKIKFIL